MRTPSSRCAARSGRPAPRFWPTSAIAAVPNAAPDRKLNDSQRMAMPWAAWSTSPKALLTMAKNHKCPSVTDKLSNPAGTLTHNNRLIRSPFGQSNSARNLRPARPRISTAKTAAPPTEWATAVPRPMPAKPRAGIGPSP